MKEVKNEEQIDLTSAIEMIIRSLGIKDSTILIPTNTFFATAEAVIHSGNKVKFIDSF